MKDDKIIKYLSKYNYKIITFILVLTVIILMVLFKYIHYTDFITTLNVILTTSAIGIGSYYSYKAYKLEAPNLEVSFISKNLIDMNVYIISIRNTSKFDNYIDSIINENQTVLFWFIKNDEGLEKPTCIQANTKKTIDLKKRNYFYRSEEGLEKLILNSQELTLKDEANRRYKIKDEVLQTLKNQIKKSKLVAILK